MRVLGAVMSLLLVLAACGGDAEGGSTSTTVAPVTTTTMVESTTTEPVTTTTAASTTTTVPGQPLRVVFASADQSDCANVASVERVVGAGVDPVLAAFELLVAGPTPAEEASGLGSMFSEETAGMVRSAELSGGLLTVDFDDFSAVIPNASTSCGSMSLIAQLNGTAFQFDGIESVTYSFEGSCEAFFNWLQRDCQVYEAASLDAEASETNLGCGVAPDLLGIESGVAIADDAVFAAGRAEKYIGIVVPHMATRQVIDGFRHFGTFVGTGYGGIFTYRRGSGDDLEYLGLVIDHDNGHVTTDAVLLATNGAPVSLAASCPAKALVLYPGQWPELAGYPGLGAALTHWTVDEDGRFVSSASQVVVTDP